MDRLEAERAAREHMARFGVDPPGSLVWDGKRHDFDTPDRMRRGKKSQWYRAYPDAPPYCVTFGCFRFGVNEKWVSKNGRPDELDPEKWEKIQAEHKKREQEEEQRRHDAAREARMRFENAPPANLNHPYLVRKMVRTTWGIKQEGDLLLIPMKAMEEGNPIVSLQEIDAEGDKKFPKDARTKGTRVTIGGASLDPEHPICFAEGWATGWSIHESTGWPVVVCFSAYNLRDVTVGMRERYPDKKFLIAADNDRWTSTPQGPNPGVQAARKAAEDANCLIACPDFEDLDSKPTDFNDLYVLEGAEAVKRWLDPVQALRAVITEDGQTLAGLPEAPRKEEEPEKKKRVDQNWTEAADFRILGYNRGSYFFLPKSSGQLVELTAQQIDRRVQLFRLAPLSWWEDTFPSGKGADWLTAADALMQTAHKNGVFTYERLRGRGAWPVENEETGDMKDIVLHLGDRLLPPGSKKFIAPEEYVDPANRIYQRESRLQGPSQKTILDVETTRRVLDIYKEIAWYDSTSAHLCAGWTVLAPICGALEWRPHIWLLGGTGAGKSTIMRKVMKPLLGGMVHFFEQGSTEAGIRQTVQYDAIPVLYDEAEQESARAAQKMQAVLGLIRSSSSADADATTRKGTSSGQALGYHVRSMFALASVGGHLDHEADKTRISLLQMKSRGGMDPERRKAHWAAFEPKLSWLTQDLGRKLVARTLLWLRDGRFHDTLEVCKRAATAVLGDQRSGDQYGTLYAGAWILMDDEPPTEDEAREVMGAEDLQTYIEDQEPEGKKALQILMQQVVLVDTSNGMKHLAVGQLLGIVEGVLQTAGESLPATFAEADTRFRQLGFKVEINNGQKMLLISRTSTWIHDTLKDTPYQNIQSTMKTLPDVYSVGPTRFAPGNVARAMAVPVRHID